MRYLVLVSDYDDTIANRGGAGTGSSLSNRTASNLRPARDIANRQTTRRPFSGLSTRNLFDYVVAENGALVYEPRTGEQILLGRPRKGKPPFSMRIISARAERIRHLRKYAEGNMRDRSFYFRGPQARHNLKAHNLAIFAQIAEGIDEEPWLFHLHAGDYTRWFRDAVKDPYLADHAERIQQSRDLRPAQTRELIVSFIESRYTLPE